jgi:hypothetical protein
MTKPKRPTLTATQRALAKVPPQDRAMRAIKEIMPPGTWIALVTVAPQTDLNLRADAPNALVMSNMLTNAAAMVADDARKFRAEQEELKAAGGVA